MPYKWGAVGSWQSYRDGWALSEGPGHMRYKLVAEVDGDLYLEEAPISVERGDLLFEFISDETGRITHVAVSKRIPDGQVENFRSSVHPGEGEHAAHITIGGDREIHEQLVKQLQLLESDLAFSSGAALRHLDWATPVQEFIPESVEEEQLIAVSSFSHQKEYPCNPVRFTASDLNTLVKYAPRYASLRIPKAFWRQGMLYFSSFQYVQAFYHFYFVIEDFYAKGKSGKKPVLKEFGKSDEFLKLADNTMKSVMKYPCHRDNLLNFFETFNCEVTPTGLQEMLFEIRGSLHHYSSRSTRPTPTPFNQAQFETIALLAMHLVTTAIGYRIAEINRSSAGDS